METSLGCYREGSGSLLVTCSMRDVFIYAWGALIGTQCEVLFWATAHEEGVPFCDSVIIVEFYALQLAYFAGEVSNDL